MSTFQLFCYLVASLGLAGQLGDLITTAISFSKGAVEGNSLLAKWPHWALYLLKIVVGVLPIAMVYSSISELQAAGMALGAGAAIVGITQTIKNISFIKGLK